MTSTGDMQQSSDGSWVRSRGLDLLCLLLLTAAVFLLFETSPRVGDFWWSDAARHAMDGVFYYDLFRSLPFAHLTSWAMDYYIQYPAVTILFYPPVFALIEAAFFSLLGVSHTTAQLTVSTFLLAASYGTYFMARLWLDRVASLSMALLFIGSPAVAFWGRQVMLEVPAFSFLIWGCYFFFRYSDSSRVRDLYIATALLLAACYTKQSVAFIVPVCALTLCLLYRNEIVRRKEVWWSALMFSVGVVPLTIFTWLWGGLNMKQVTGDKWADTSRTTLSGWFYVARQWPHQVGWVVLVLAVIYCVGAFLYKNWRLPNAVTVFFVGWLVVGYLFFALIALKLERYTIFLIFPLIFFAVLTLGRGLPAKLVPFATAVLGIGIFAHTLLTEHVPFVSGYRAAAEYVCSIAPPESVVLFSGRRDGSFIFNVRTLQDCRNLTVIRADKLLLSLRGNRFLFGVKDLGVTEQQFQQMLGQYGVRYVVAQPNFWSDLQSMQMVSRVLHRDQFKLLTTVPIIGDGEPDEAELEIYQNLSPAAQRRTSIQFDLPAFGLTIRGNIGTGK